MRSKIPSVLSWFAFTTLIVSLYACENKSGLSVDLTRNICKDDYAPRKIEVKVNEKILNIGACGYLESFVILDSTEMIGSIDKLQVAGDKMYILDKKKSKAIFCYSIYGKLLWKYSKSGRGRGKFMQLGDIHVQNDKVYALDNTALKIIEIDTLGLFIKDVPLGKNKNIYPDELFVDTNENIILYSFDMADHDYFPFEMAVMDSSCKKVLSYHIEKKHDPAIKRWGFDISPLQCLGNNKGFYYTKAMNDTIYKYESGTFSRKYVVDFGADAVPEAVKARKNYTLDKFYKSNYKGNIQRVAETDSIVTFMFGKGGSPGYTFFDKYTLQSKSYPMTVFNINKYHQMLLPLGSWNDRIITQVSPMEIIRYIEYFKKKYPGLTEEQYDAKIEKEMPLLNEIRKRISPAANPILVFINLSRAKLFSNEKI